MKFDVLLIVAISLLKLYNNCRNYVRSQYIMERHYSGSLDVVTYCDFILNVVK